MSGHSINNITYFYSTTPCAQIYIFTHKYTLQINIAIANHAKKKVMNSRSDMLRLRSYNFVLQVFTYIFA